MWTREEDMRHDVYRPAYRNIMRASLKDGRINGWSHKIAAGLVSARVSGKPLEDGIDGGSVEGATELTYTIPHQRVDSVQAEPQALRLGWWRGEGHTNRSEGPRERKELVEKEKLSGRPICIKKTNSNNTYDN